MSKANTGEQLRRSFLAKIKVEENGCWAWLGSTNSRSGYGAIRVNGILEKAHRVAYFLKHGTYPKHNGTHTCDNIKCVNWDHIEDKTQSENLFDCSIRDRHGRIKITEAQVIEAYNRYNTEFITLKELGLVYNCSASSLCKIFKGVSRGHIKLD